MRIDQQKAEKIFQRHKNNSTISAEDHVQNLRLALGQSLEGKTKIYLDKRFWILIRDVELNRSQSKSHAELLFRLKELVDLGNTICPISETLFLELLKQTDKRTQRATAQMIDSLSGGITLSPADERVVTEIAHFIHTYAEKNIEQYPLDRLVWLKLCNVLGITYPINTIFDSKDELMIQKVFIDYLWEMPLTEMIDILSESEPIPQIDFSLLAHNLNEGSAKHSHEINNFQQTYLAELSGGLDVAKGQAVDVIERLFEKATGKKPDYSQEDREKYEKDVYNYFANLFRIRGSAIELRTLHIHAKCHAAIRWDKKRKIKPNDLYDFHHAAAAIGYCDAFFTDRPLHVLLTANHIALDKEFNCDVISDVDEAIKYMNDISG